MPPNEPDRTQPPPPPAEPRPWTMVLSSNRDAVSWFRAKVEQPRYAGLTTRRGRRGLTGVHLLTAVGLAAQFPLGQRFPFVWIVLFLPLVVAHVVGTWSLHAVTFGMLALDPTDLDERQRLIRGDAHHRAHRISAWIVFVPVVWLLGRATIEEVADADTLPAWFADPSTTVALVALVALVAAVMPMYVLAWSSTLDDPDDRSERGGHDAR